jgi:hypothetical protein
MTWTREQMDEDREWRRAWDDRLDRLRFENQGDGAKEIAELMGERAELPPLTEPCPVRRRAIPGSAQTLAPERISPCWTSS